MQLLRSFLALQLLPLPLLSQPALRALLGAAGAVGQLLGTLEAFGAVGQQLPEQALYDLQQVRG